MRTRKSKDWVKECHKAAVIKNINNSEAFIGCSSQVLEGTVVSPNASKKRRDPKACEERKQQNSEPNNKLAWNIEDEVVKVLEKGMALGFNFNEKKNELLDIIAKRDKVNDNRFRDLVRRLVLKNKAIG